MAPTMAAKAFTKLSQELSNMIYDDVFPKRIVPALFLWHISQPQTRKRKCQHYHPNPNTVKKLPAITQVSEDALDFFHTWHQQVNMPVMTCYFHPERIQHGIVDFERYAAPVWFSWRNDVLSLAELANSSREFVDWVLAVEDGPGKLLNDKRVAVALDHQLLNTELYVRDNPSEDEQEKQQIAQKLLRRAGHHEEWIYTVGHAKVPLPREDPRAKSHFHEEEQTTLVDVDDQKTIDWLISHIKTYNQYGEEQRGVLKSMYGAARDLCAYSLKSDGKLKKAFGEDAFLDVESIKSNHRRQVRQAWLAANNCVDPRIADQFLRKRGWYYPEVDEPFASTPTPAHPDMHPNVKECLDRMPKKIRYCIRVELFHPGQWTLNPKEDEAEFNEGKAEVEEEAEVQDPLFYPDSTAEMEPDERGQIDRKRMFQKQRARRQKSSKREAKKRSNRGDKDRMVEPSLKMQQAFIRIQFRNDCEEFISRHFLGDGEYVSRERLWKPNAPSATHKPGNSRNQDEIDYAWYVARN